MARNLARSLRSASGPNDRDLARMRRACAAFAGGRFVVHVAGDSSTKRQARRGQVLGTSARMGRLARSFTARALCVAGVRFRRQTDSHESRQTNRAGRCVVRTPQSSRRLSRCCKAPRTLLRRYRSSRSTDACGDRRSISGRGCASPSRTTVDVARGERGDCAFALAIHTALCAGRHVARSVGSGV